MAKQRKRDETSDRSSLLGGWRPIAALAIGAVGLLAPIAALAGRSVATRREQASWSPGMLVLPLAGVLVTALAGTLAWRGRDRIATAARDAAATVQDAAASVQEVASRLDGDDASEDDAAATWATDGGHVAA